MPFQLSLPGLAAGLPINTANVEQNLTDLWAYPDVPSAALCTHAKLIGAAGEALVDSMLMRLGLISIPLPEAFPADRLILHSEGLISLQIKTCSTARNGVYSFSIQKGYQHSPAGLRNYETGDFDILACVALPENVVLFSAGLRTSCRIRLSEVPGLRRSPRCSLEEAFHSLGISCPASASEMLDPSAPHA